MRGLRRVIALVMFFTWGATSWAQLPEAERWGAQVENAYEVEPNVTYPVVNNYEAKLDVYQFPPAETASASKLSKRSRAFSQSRTVSMFVCKASA